MFGYAALSSFGEYRMSLWVKQAQGKKRIWLRSYFVNADDANENKLMQPYCAIPTFGYPRAV